jgi:hypothetical protein
MDMKNYSMRQRGVHRRFERCSRISFGRIHIAPQAVLNFRQIQGSKDFVAQSISHPLAGSFHPKHAIQLYRAVARARLREQRICSCALGEFQ